LKEVSYWRDLRNQLFGSTFGFLTTEDRTDKLSRNVDKKMTATRCALKQKSAFLRLHTALAIHKGKCKVHPCTDTEALYRPYGP